MLDPVEFNPLRRLVHHALGWLALVVGVAVMGAIILTPAKEQLDQAKWYQGFVELYALRQHDQVRNYERFSSALSAGDPVVLSRLAFTHLRLKPEGTELVSVPQADYGNTTYHVSDGPAMIDSSDDAGDLTATDRYHLALIEQWLHTATPMVGRDYSAYEPRRDWVSRLATGSARVPLLVIGGLLIWAGLVMPGPATRDSAVLDDEAWVEGELDPE